MPDEGGLKPLFKYLTLKGLAVDAVFGCLVVRKVGYGVGRRQATIDF